MNARVEAGTPAASEQPEWRLRDVPLGGSPLSQALQDDPTLHGWMAAPPRSAAEWRSRTSALQAGAQTSDWLTPLAPAFAATGRAAERLGRAAAGGVVVTTGQQPGLFGGPAYTWSKAFSALATADVLQELTGVPVAPVFWAATDDADWMEAAVTYLATSHGLERIAMPGPATEGVAMADVPLGPLEQALDALRANCGSAANRSLLLLLENAYVPHATVGAAYVQLLRGVLEPLGIAVLDASHDALRSAADVHLRSALQHAGGISAALSARSDEIRAAGFTPQVDVLDELSLVFHSTTGPSGKARDRTRTRVPVSDAHRVTREAAMGSLGANVLLRPVVERALLPTVAYHAGPGELAYFAQISPIAQAMGVVAPLAIPRWAGEVISCRADALREDLGIDESLLSDPHAAETFVARHAVSTEVQDAVDRLQVAVDTQVRALAESVAGADDIVPTNVVEGLGVSLSRRVERFERRVRAGIKRREVVLMRGVASVRAALRPNGKSPERVLNLLPMMVRYGPELLQAMQRHAHAHARHRVHSAE